MASESFRQMFIKSGLEHYAQPKEFLSLGSLLPLGALSSGPNTLRPYVYPTAFPHRNMWKTIKRLNYSVSASGTKNIYRESSPGVFDELRLRVDVTASASGAEDIKPIFVSDPAKEYRSGSSNLQLFDSIDDAVTRRTRTYNAAGTVTGDVTTTNKLQINLNLTSVLWDGSNYVLSCLSEIDTAVATVSPDIFTDFDFRTDRSDFPGNSNVGNLSLPEFGATPFRLDRAEDLQLSSWRIEFVSLIASASFTVNERFS